MPNYICFLLFLAVMAESILSSIKWDVQVTYNCIPNCPKITLAGKEADLKDGYVLESKAISLDESIVIEILAGGTGGKCGVEAIFYIDYFQFQTKNNTLWHFPQEFSINENFVGSENCIANQKYEVIFKLPSTFEELNDAKELFSGVYTVISQKIEIPNHSESLDLDIPEFVEYDFSNPPENFLLRFTFDESQKDELISYDGDQPIQSGKVYSFAKTNSNPIRYVVDPSRWYTTEIKFHVIKLFDTFQMENSNEGTIEITIFDPNCKTQNGQECSVCNDEFVFKDNSKVVCHRKEDVPSNYGQSQVDSSMYLPCYETCLKCNIVGESSSSHKCTECHANYPEETAEGDTFNCLASSNSSDDVTPENSEDDEENSSNGLHPIILLIVSLILLL